MSFLSLWLENGTCSWGFSSEGKQPRKRSNLFGVEFPIELSNKIWTEWPGRVPTDERPLRRVDIHTEIGFYSSPGLERTINQIPFSFKIIAWVLGAGSLLTPRER